MTTKKTTTIWHYLDSHTWARPKVHLRMELSPILDLAQTERGGDREANQRLLVWALRLLRTAKMAFRAYQDSASLHLKLLWCLRLLSPGSGHLHRMDATTMTVTAVEGVGKEEGMAETAIGIEIVVMETMEMTAVAAVEAVGEDGSREVVAAGIDVIYKLLTLFNALHAYSPTLYLNSFHIWESGKGEVGSGPSKSP